MSFSYFIQKYNRQKIYPVLFTIKNWHKWIRLHFIYPIFANFETEHSPPPPQDIFLGISNTGTLFLHWSGNSQSSVIRLYLTIIHRHVTTGSQDGGSVVEVPVGQLLNGTGQQPTIDKQVNHSVPHTSLGHWNSKPGGKGQKSTNLNTFSTKCSATVKAVN